MLCLVWTQSWMSLGITSPRTQSHHFYINCSANSPHCFSSSGTSPAGSGIPDPGMEPLLLWLQSRALGSSPAQETVMEQRHNRDIARRAVYIPVRKSCRAGDWVRYHKAEIPNHSWSPGMLLCILSVQASLSTGKVWIYSRLLEFYGAQVRLWSLDWCCLEVEPSKPGRNSWDKS